MPTNISPLTEWGSCYDLKAFLQMSDVLIIIVNCDTSLSFSTTIRNSDSGGSYYDECQLATFATFEAHLQETATCNVFFSNFRHLTLKLTFNI